MYYSFAQPRAVIWQMYLCTVAIVYACTGTAYLMSQVSAVWTPPFLLVSPAFAPDSTFPAGLSRLFTPLTPYLFLDMSSHCYWWDFFFTWR